MIEHILGIKGVAYSMPVLVVFHLHVCAQLEGQELLKWTLTLIMTPLQCNV